MILTVNDTEINLKMFPRNKYRAPTYWLSSCIGTPCMRMWTKSKGSFLSSVPKKKQVTCLVTDMSGSVQNERLAYTTLRKLCIPFFFHIVWDTIVVTVFLSILNQIEFHLVQNQKENGTTILSHSMWKEMET